MPTSKRQAARNQAARVTDTLAALVEAVANKVLSPLDIVLLTRDRIQETLEEAAERGRITRSDANELVAELLRRGRQQTDELLAEAAKRTGRE